MTKPILLEFKGINYQLTWDPDKALGNKYKHGVNFSDAATVFLDEWAMTEYDSIHSLDEERWLTMGHEQSGRILVVSHTYCTMDSRVINIRIISARIANKRERLSFVEHCKSHSQWGLQQNTSPYGAKMNPANVINSDDDTPREFNFSRAIHRKYFHPDMQLQMPIYMDPVMLKKLTDMARQRKIMLSSLIQDVLTKGLAMVEADQVQADTNDLQTDSTKQAC